LRLQTERKLNPHVSKLAREEEFWRALEHRVWASVDSIFYPSQNETDHVKSWIASNSLRTEAITIPVYAFQRFRENVREGLANRKDILFVGGFGHPPNVDGVVWFIREILPLVLCRRRNVHVYLAGSNPSEEVRKLASPDITVTGFISDDELEQYYNSARVAVAPLRYGAGVKGKVVEALRFGLPIVTTSIGAQGLAHISDTIAIADDPQAFAGHVLRLLSDDDCWLKQAVAGVEAAKAHFSRKAMIEAIAGVFKLYPLDKMDK
jgi:glycosyltransferase involved in cell wall biosynthesis